MEIYLAYTALGLIVWTISGAVFAFWSWSKRGKCGGKDPWYEWVLVAPLLLIAATIGLFLKRK